jgi:hypothetical protein
MPRPGHRDEAVRLDVTTTDMLPTITGISPPSITESPQLMGLGVSSLTSAD